MIVGVTGHRNIDSSDIEWIMAEIQSFLRSHNVTSGYTCLAIGADQLFADALHNAGISFHAVTPCEQYEITFEDAASKLKYNELKSLAASDLKLDFDQPSEQAFLEAGKKVVEFSDMILAIWNGKGAAGKGGTGDVVAYARRLCRRIMHIDPVMKTAGFIDPAGNR